MKPSRCESLYLRSSSGIHSDSILRTLRCTYSMNTRFALFATLVGLLAKAPTQTNATVVFEEPWGTNSVVLSFTNEGIRFVAPKTNPPPLHGSTTVGIVTVDSNSGGEFFWRYRLEFANKQSSSNLVLWERSFPNHLGRANPNGFVEFLGYHVDSNLNHAVVFSRDSSGTYGDISQPGIGRATNLVRGSRALVLPKGGFGISNPPISAKVSPSVNGGTYNGLIKLLDGSEAGFVFTGYRWRPKSWAEAQVKDADPSTGEVLVFDRPHGTNRVVCSYRPLDDLTGLKLATEAKGATVAADEVEPFDRKYRLVLRSPEKPRELVLWEKLFTCDDTTRVAGFPVWKSFSDPSIKFRGPSDQIVGTRIIDPSVTVLGVFVDPDLPRAVVFYYHRNCIFGEVLQPGVSKATNLPGARQFSWLNYEPEAPTAVLSRSGIPGTYQVNLTFGSGRKSSFRFDGSQWVTD